MKILCKVKSASDDKIVLTPLQKFDCADICGENATVELIVSGCATD